MTGSPLSGRYRALIVPTSLTNPVVLLKHPAALLFAVTVQPASDAADLPTAASWEFGDGCARWRVRMEARGDGGTRMSQTTLESSLGPNNGVGWYAD